jgi:hypothetical protein
MDVIKKFGGTIMPGDRFTCAVPTGLGFLINAYPGGWPTLSFLNPNPS